MNEMRHTILVTDIEKKIAPPDISMYGSRLVYTFEGNKQNSYRSSKSSEFFILSFVYYIMFLFFKILLT